MQGENSRWRRRLEVNGKGGPAYTFCSRIYTSLLCREPEEMQRFGYGLRSLDTYPNLTYTIVKHIKMEQEMLAQLAQLFIIDNIHCKCNPLFLFENNF